MSRSAMPASISHSRPMSRTADRSYDWWRPPGRIRPLLSQPPAPVRLLREQGGPPDVLRVRTRRTREGALRSRRLRDPAGRDQDARVRPGAPEDWLAAAAGAANLRAGAVRRCRAALLRAADPGAARRVGRPEAALGAAALTACG